MRLDAIPIGKNAPDDVNVIIEVPIGGEPIKYEIEKASGAWYVMDTLSKGEYRAGYIQRLAEVSAARQTGFIAQEVEAAAAAIGYDFDGVHHPVDANDHYTLGYELFTLPLIQAVKEQHAVIEELEQVNVMLEQRIAEMEVANGPLQKAP